MTQTVQVERSDLVWFRYGEPGKFVHDFDAPFRPADVQLHHEDIVGKISYAAMFTEPGGTGEMCGLFILDPKFSLNEAIELHGPVISRKFARSFVVKVEDPDNKFDPVEKQFLDCHIAWKESRK